MKKITNFIWLRNIAMNLGCRTNVYEHYLKEYSLITYFINNFQKFYILVLYSISILINATLELEIYYNCNKNYR